LKNDSLYFSFFETNPKVPSYCVARRSLGARGTEIRRAGFEDSQLQVASASPGIC
jgi:hypothetical protein